MAMPTPSGLTDHEARTRLHRDGPNELPTSTRSGALQLLWEVVREPMFLLLVACGAIYLALGDRHEALMLLGFVLIVIAMTYVQKRRSQAALDALRDMSSPRALVMREGVAKRIPGRDLVLGDLVLLAEGDRVPADIALQEVSYLTVDESLLTGEAVPVLKHASDRAASDTATSECMSFAGTLVTQGTGQGVVVATGARSALGQIGASLTAIAAGDTPIQQETAQVVKRVASLGAIIALALALGWAVARDDWLAGLLAGLTLAMAILPEELPVVLTIFLGLGAWRLARERVLTRNIPAVELLGATTVLCVDKTGTLTRNQMEVRRLWTVSASFELGTQAQVAMPHTIHPLLEYAVLSSHRSAFDPMEAAIGAAGQHWLKGYEHLHADWSLISDYPLSRELLAMSRVWRSPDHSELLVAAKGAPEAIVDLCHLPDSQSSHIAQAVECMAAQGLRVLGVARAACAAQTLPLIQHDFAFEFIGLIGLEDPVRADVPAAIAECQAAGIRVSMITGDHPHTAMAIARQVGLDTTAGSLTGGELDTLNDSALAARLDQTNVFCRVRPEQKLRLVRAFQARGDVVAMTGDGVNDAPALKAANIGVAMGARGTDVAREAADLVLLNDDFGSLVKAVRHGRRVFANLRKAIAFVLAAHLPIIGLSVVPVLMGWPMILMPAHILFLQLIIDPACSIVFEAEALEAGTMRRLPRPSSAHLFDRPLLTRGLLQGAGLLLAVLAGYQLAVVLTGVPDAGRTQAFVGLVLGNLALIQANRSWSTTDRQTRHRNPAFLWITAGALALLSLALGIPAVATLFRFTAPSPTLLILAGTLTAMAWLWFSWVNVRQARLGHAD
ncbi:MAG: P-type Ca2+ transporter type [Pseudomonadota bacterium]|nr:P-type Ca2+ transporter type [Pseudomonadota bacterium]